MILNRNSWHYKVWRETFGLGGQPSSTDLCRYCHRVFWALLLMTVVSLGCLFLVGMMGIGVIMMFIEHTSTCLIAVGAIIALIAVGLLYSKWLNKDTNTEPTTLIGKYVDASKQKVCPLVEFED